MKSVLVLTSMLFAATLASAQTPAAPDPPPDIQIVKYNWSKDRMNWEKDPFSAGDRSVFDTRTRVTEERRRGTALEERQARELKADKDKPTAPPRYVFAYKLTVINGGAKMIKEIDWDYIFRDAATGEELGRRQFTSVEKIGPGKRKELSVLLYSPPTQRISVKTLGNN